MKMQSVEDHALILIIKLLIIKLQLYLIYRLNNNI